MYFDVNNHFLFKNEQIQQMNSALLNLSDNIHDQNERRTAQE